MACTRSITAVCAVTLGLALWTGTSISVYAVEAPPIHDIETGKKADLGGWNDIIVLRDTGQFMLRRGDELSSLSLSGIMSLKPLGTESDCRASKMVVSAHAGGKSWVFFESRDVMPFALETDELKRVDFVVPGVKLPGLHPVHVYSCWVVPQHGVAFISVLSVDAETWPREYNRPIYFWMDLKSGQTVRFPTGWDLHSFSPDQTEAVFEAQQEEPLHRRPWHAVDVRTGASLAAAPGREQAFVPFIWSNTQRVRPVFVRRPPTQDRTFLIGLALDGASCGFDIQDANKWFLSEAMAEDGFVGCILRPGGAGWQQPSPLYVAQLEKDLDPRVISKSAEVFELLQHGNSVYVAPQPKPKEDSADAFFYDWAAGGSWNVLDQVEQLPPLPPEYVGKSFIEDKTSVRLIRGMGGQEGDQLVMGLFSHNRADMRATALPESPPPTGRVSWRRTVVLSAAGQRYMTDLFRGGAAPDSIWLHNSGKVITSEPDSGSAGSEPGYPFHLYEVDLSLPTSRER